jgi:molybdenum cofactor biosynthesis enzyme MoaA
VLLALVLTRAADRRSNEGCLFCHENGARMEEMGYPQFTVTAEEVERESRMSRPFGNAAVRPGGAPVAPLC